MMAVCQVGNGLHVACIDWSVVVRRSQVNTTFHISQGMEVFYLSLL